MPITAIHVFLHKLFGGKTAKKYLEDNHERSSYCTPAHYIVLEGYDDCLKFLGDQGINFDLQYAGLFSALFPLEF